MDSHDVIDSRAMDAPPRTDRQETVEATEDEHSHWLISGWVLAGLILLVTTAFLFATVY